jgi:hypothetical protein
MLLAFAAVVVDADRDRTVRNAISAGDTAIIHTSAAHLTNTSLVVVCPHVVEAVEHMKVEAVEDMVDMEAVVATMDVVVEETFKLTSLRMATRKRWKRRRPQRKRVDA